MCFSGASSPCGFINNSLHLNKKGLPPANCFTYANLIWKTCTLLPLSRTDIYILYNYLMIFIWCLATYQRNFLIRCFISFMYVCSGRGVSKWWFVFFFRKNKNWNHSIIFPCTSYQLNVIFDLSSIKSFIFFLFLCLYPCSFNHLDKIRIFDWIII